MKIFCHSLVVLFLVSCGGNLPEAGISSSERPLTTPAALATEPPPTKTPSPTKQPTSTPITLLSAYSLPAWMSDPSTAILAALLTNDVEHTRKISFFNAATEESYEILMPRDVSGYFWYDNANFGFLSTDLKVAYKIKLQTGEVSTESVSSQATQFLTGEYEYEDYENSYGDTANALQSTRDRSTNELLFRRTRYGQYGNKSRNGRFSADWNDNRTGVIVTDNQTDQVIWESQALEGTYGTFFKWSPTDENHLAYLQGKPTEPPTDFITESITLTIVDVVSGEVLGNYAGDFGIMEWSPDGKKILYEGAETLYQNYGIQFQDAPCILFLNLGEKRCLRSIPRLVPEGYRLLTTGTYEWGPDNQTILYSYIYERQDDRIGNLCIYSLVTSYINCPLTI